MAITHTRKVLAIACALAASPLLALSAEASSAALAADRAAVLHDLYQQERQQENIFTVHFPDAETARRAAISFHDALLESDAAAFTLTLQIDDEDVARLRRDGYPAERADAFIARRNAMLARIERAGPGASLIGRNAIAGVDDFTGDSIPGFSCYQTVEETQAAALAIVAAHPTLASYIDIGDSWEKTQGLPGHDMNVLKLANSKTGGVKPKLFITSAIHAREYATAPLALAFAQQLVDGYGTDADSTWILDNTEIHLLLQTNPDGRKQAESGLLWRKNTDQNYCGATSVNRGADLNRNFAFSWNDTNGRGSSGAQCNETYRGASPASEPEVQAVQDYAHALWPDNRGPGRTDAAPSDTMGIHIDLHSYAQLVLWPWGDVKTPSPNSTALQTLGRKFAWYNHYTPEQSYGLYPTDGTSDGPSYGDLGVAAYTFEVGSSFFESCTSYTNTVKPANLPALVYAAKVARAPYLWPAGPDVGGIQLKPNAQAKAVAAGTLVKIGATATDLDFSKSNGTEPTQPIAAAEYYVDIPPWQAGAVANPLAPRDGAFDTPTENVGGRISTAGWKKGAHLVYVRSQDTAGNWGAPSAVFVRIK